jgi:hypothetical protein
MRPPIRQHSLCYDVPNVPMLPKRLRIRLNPVPLSYRRFPNVPSITNVLSPTSFIRERPRKQLVQYYKAREHLATLVDRQLIPKLFPINANEIADTFVTDVHSISVDRELGSL